MGHDEGVYNNEETALLMDLANAGCTSMDMRKRAAVEF